MKAKNNRLQTLRMLISSKELCSQDEVLRALEKEGYNVTQATLSRDMKQLKVAKATNLGGRYFYVLPNETMYKRVSSPKKAAEMLLTSGFVSINFSANMAVIKTRPGYASSIAYNIDNGGISCILGTIAGDDTIFIVIKEGVKPETVIEGLKNVIPDVSKSDT
ncbi:MAG: arginine repressor [Prevotellaceae bacterium]|nr:arginine repressor [Prevotellaceae bacterium]